MNKNIDIKKILSKTGIYIVLLLLIAMFSFLSDNFFNINTLFNILRQVSFQGIAAIGMAIVLLLGGIDLSIGSNITLVNILCAMLMVDYGVNPFLAAIIAIVVSTFIGFTNGFIISKIDMPPIIVTLSMMIIVEGIAYLLCSGLPIFGFPKSFTILGQGFLWIIPIPIIVMVICFILSSILLNKTYFGRYFYAVGDNERATLLCGVNTKRVKYVAYALSGLFAGIAGIVLLSRTNSGQVTAGKGMEFDVLTACVLGGISVTGGYGSISNVVAGVLILGVLNTGMVQLDVTSYVQLVVKGIVLMVAVAFDIMQKKKIKKSL